MRSSPKMFIKIYYYSVERSINLNCKSKRIKKNNDN